jgi:hypothetical protein
MNTTPNTERSKFFRNKFSSLNVQYACCPLLGALVAVPVCAQTLGTLSIPPRGNSFPQASQSPAPSPGNGTGTLSPLSIPPRGNSFPQASQSPAPSPGNGTGTLSPPSIPPPSNNSVSTQATQLPLQLIFPNGTNLQRKMVGPGGNPLETSASLISGNLEEVLPSAQQLSESMSVISDSGKKTEPVNVDNQNTPCIDVNLRPDPARQSVSLVDFTGTGLIVSAVSNNHIQSVFAQAGYARIDLARAARWCIPQMAARALLAPTQGRTTQVASLLVQTANGPQLMSQDQWLAHQIVMKPRKIKTVTAVQSGSTGKTGKQLASKRSTKPLSNVAKSTVSVPAL